MVWHFIEYPRQDVSGENMYVCSGTITLIWTPMAHGFALPIGMVVKSAVELIIHDLSFLGVKKTWTTNSIQVRGNFEFKSQEKKNWHFLYQNGRWGWLSKWSVSSADWRGHSKQQCFTDSFLLWCRDANWNNRRISRSIGIWIKIDWRGKRPILQKKKTSWLETQRDFSMHWKIRNLTFQNLRKRVKILNFTLTFHTGIHLCFFMICYMRPRT